MDTRATILIAGDPHHPLLSQHSVLRHAGYRVVMVESGKACLEIAAKISPDLILASSPLPDMNGENICQHIKTNPQLLETTVLLCLPKDASPEQQARLAASDADGYITSSIPSEELLSRIKTILQIEKLSSASSSGSEEYQEMLATSPLPYQSLDTNGRIVRVNRAWLETLGYDHEDEVVGRFFGDFLDPQGKRLFPDRFTYFKKTGRVCCVEFEMRRKDNTPLWVSFDGRIACDEAGAFRQTHCMFRDITEHKKLVQKKEFRPESILRPYTLATCSSLGICVLAAFTYILGFHDLGTPMASLGMGLVAIIFSIVGYIFFRFGRHIRKMILFYVQEVAKREQSLRQLNKNLEAMIEKKTKKLSTSEQKYRQYIESSPLSIFVTNKTGDYIDVNPAGCALLGYTREEFLQLRIAQLIPPGQRSHVIKDFKKIRRTGVTSGEYLLTRKDGTSVYVNIEAVTLEGIGYMAFCQNIDAQKKMEKDLLLNKKRLEALLTLAGMAHAPLHEITDFALKTVIDLTESETGFLAFVNEDETILTLHSWAMMTAEQCSMKNPTKIFHAQKSGMWMEGLRSREPYICNDYNLDRSPNRGYPQGHLTITRHANVPIIDDGHIVLIVGVANKATDYGTPDIMQISLLTQGVRDILKHRKNEEITRASEEQLRITLNSIGDGVITTDIVGQVLAMNPVAEELTGWPLHEARGTHLKKIFQLLDIHTKKPLADPAQAIMRENQGKGVNDQSLLVSRKGTTYRIAKSGTPIRDKTGNINGAVLVFRDISEEYRIQKELQKMHNMESIGTLAGGIAHDFNNILMGLLGHIELAKTQIPENHIAHQNLDQAGHSVDRAVQLSRQLLAFAKGGAPIKKNIGLQNLVKEVIRFDLSGSPVKPVFTIAEDLWRIDADKGQVQQIFSNLAINAKQAMPHGGHLYVTLCNTDLTHKTFPKMEPGRYVKIVVQDEGSGIPAQAIEHVFDPYFSTKKTGNGLGLTTVYTIVHKHGGCIDVSSDPEKGTCFTIHLPASAVGKDIPSPPPAPDRKQPVTAATILVMDDEQMIQDVMRALLQSLGYTCQTVSDGSQAIDVYKHAINDGAPFDAVIMDLTIPGGMGGQEAVKGILAIDPLARVIVSSGYADDPVMANYAEYGFKAMATKPYTRQKLHDVLSRVLEV